MKTRAGKRTAQFSVQIVENVGRTSHASSTATIYRRHLREDGSLWTKGIREAREDPRRGGSEGSEPWQVG
jgi:hypothetical protein